MTSVKYETLLELQKNPKNIRNICILAHIDHGKTSLADSLLATNGFISKRQAGSLRFLDSRPDEQKRGITMKNSTVSLHYAKNEENFLINVIDSPGHVDFHSEQLAAARISEGMLLVVDVIEGLCVQTKSAIEMAVLEKVKMILVINKIDKLIIDKSLTGDEIFVELKNLVENVNAYIAQVHFRNLALMFDELGDLPESIEDEFDPILHNVIFASAGDGWAFKLSNFVDLYAKQLDLPKNTLLKHMWGDYYYDKHMKSYIHGARERDKKPLLVSVIIDNLITVYEHLYVYRNDEKVGKIIDRLRLRKTHDIIKSTGRNQLRAIMSEWLPLAENILSTVVDLVPVPSNLGGEKVNHLLCKTKINELDMYTFGVNEYSIGTCVSDDTAPVIAYITKVYAIDKKNIVKPSNVGIPTPVDIQAKREAVRQLKESREYKKLSAEYARATNTMNLTEERVESGDLGSNLEFIACTRIYSGTLKVNTVLYLLPSNHSPHELGLIKSPEMLQEKLRHVIRVSIDNLYILLGKDVIPVTSVPAGNIVGIGGMKSYMIRSGTLSSTLECTPLIEPHVKRSEPFFKCAIEPVNVTDMNTLLQGIKLLVQSDSCVEGTLENNGQYILKTAGQVHMEKCLEDLRNYTGVDFRTSAPMVPLKETLISFSPLKPKMKELLQNDRDLLGMTISLHACPISEYVQNFFNDNFQLLKIVERTANDGAKDSSLKSFDGVYTSIAIEQMKDKMCSLFSLSGKEWENITNRVLAISDSRSDLCILLDFTEDYRFKTKTIFYNYGCSTSEGFVANALVNAFRSAIRCGPLCGEPMKDICFSIIGHESIRDYSYASVRCYSSYLASQIKNMMHDLFCLLKPRIMEPVYVSRMLVDSGLMGKLQNCLIQCKGRIVETKFIGNELIEMEFLIPVIEGLEFCKLIRGSTQGKINPLLTFGHYVIINEEPMMPVNMNAQELCLEFDRDSGVYEIIMEVRRRKGLQAEDKVVDAAEKQRTNKKKVHFVGDLYPKLFTYNPIFRCPAETLMENTRFLAILNRSNFSKYTVNFIKSGKKRKSSDDLQSLTISG